MFSIKESIYIMWTRTIFDMNRMSLMFIFINHISVNVVNSQSLHFLFKMSIFSCSRALYWTKNEYSKLRRKFETLVQVLLWSQYRWAVFGISSVLHERNFFCFKRWWGKKKKLNCVPWKAQTTMEAKIMSRLAEIFIWYSIASFICTLRIIFCWWLDKFTLIIR